MQMLKLSCQENVENIIFRSQAVPSLDNSHSPYFYLFEQHNLNVINVNCMHSHFAMRKVTYDIVTYGIA